MRTAFCALAAAVLAAAPSAVAARLPRSSAPPDRPAAYGFVHHETTGITSSVLVNGREQPILFCPSSDRIALDTFCALRWNVLMANCDGRHIFVEGVLSRSTKRTPSAPHMAQSEEYREFTLKRWYILTPFVAYTDAAEAPDLTDTPGPYTRVRTRLDRSDFGRLPDRARLDRPALQRLARRSPSRTLQDCRREADIIERQLEAARKAMNSHSRPQPGTRAR